MAQYYQIQNLEDLKQIYADVQVVHVASEDVGVGGHNRPQQLLLPDDQLMLNEGQQVVYQTTSVPAQQQYQQQPTATTTQYIIGDEISQQQQQQTVQHQQQVMYDHHHQQQQHYVHESQQLQQDHHQLAQQTQQQQPQLYYTTEQILQPNSLVQQQQQQEMQHQQQQQQQLHVQQQQYQQQQQQQIVHQQHSMQTPQQTQQIVYRMQPQQQSQNQQTQMLNNAHVILQQPSGQQVLIQSPQHPEIIMRQSMPQQRIIYNTNRVLYTPQQQQQPQTQTILQQSPQAHQQHPQQQQHIQLQATPTTSPIHTTARLVQTRVGASPQETAQQHQQTPTQQNVVFHPIQATTVQNSQQLKPQIQQQSQMTIQQTPQQHLVASTMSGGVSGGGVMRGAIRNKSPRGGGALGSTHTLIARMPVTTVGRAIRPPLVTPIQSTQNPRATRPRGGAAGGARARGAARGARGGAVIASRNTQVATPVVQPQQQSQQLQAQQQITPSQQIMQNAMNKNITILNQQGQVKHIYRNIGDSQQQQLQLVTGTSQAQQRSTQIVGARFRTPVVSTSGNTNNGNNSSSSGNSSGNYELDLEDSIQAVVVKKDQQKPPGSTSNIANPVGTTLTSYFAKDDDDTRLVRTQNGACITLAEYRKRHPPNPGSASTTTTTILQMKTPLRASGPPSSNKILPAHSSGNTGIVPVARVAPQPIQSTQQTQQSQTPLTTTTSSSAVHRTSHNNYEIHTQHVMQNRNNTQMAEKDRNSAKMLVILVSGEQRLITFTLPRESCTVQDLLEQVGVPFDSSTTIQCVENPGANIDFVVTVGFSVQESASELISRAEQTLQMNRQQDPMGGNNLSTSNTSSGGSSTGNTNVPQGTVGQSAVTTNYGNLTSNPAQTPSAVVNESTHKDANSSNAAANTTKNTSSSSTNTTEDVPRKIIQGFLAVCQSCGFSGYDHAKCERCKRVFLEPPKRVPSVKNLGNNNASMAVDSTLSKSISNSEFMASDKRRGSDALARSQAKNALNSYGSTGSTTSARGRGGLNTTARGRGSRSGRRTAEVEPVILTLSSDEEDDDESSNKVSGSFSTMSNAANSSTFKTPTYEPLSFEHSMPDLDENAIYADFQRDDVTDLSNCTDKLSTALQCKVVRIGTYRYEPKEPVTFTSKGVCLVAPLVNNPNDSFPLHIHKREVVKIIAHFSKVSESMLCFYTLRNCAQYIKNSLQMKDNGATLDGSAYFSPNGPYQVRKIILQFSSCSDQSRNVIKSIWDFFDEISDVDAQDLLQRAEATDRQISNKTNEAASTTCVTTTQLNPNEIKQLLIYPPGKGGISINTEDYLCLATDQYLNDIIIDFYLKWVHNNVVPEAQRERAFIFSTFFYKRLTTLTRHHHNPDKDVKQTAAQKRHARVQNWTKNVNLFEKDFIIIPINEQSHWFLAIICFPTMKGPVTYDTNIPVEPQQLKKQKGKKVSLQIGNTTITPLSKRDSSTMLAEVCGVGDDDSERDEAEGDESDLASDDSDFDSGASTSAVSATISGGVAAANNNLSNSNTSISGIKSQAIKQPLILIFDSLAGASRSRVVATLRDYLTCEYRAKMSDVTPHVFNKDNMPGHCVKVPQQNNFTDCGLYLLQYVEHFFKDPIRDYRLPIKQLSNWFDTLTVTRKREDISQLLQQLMNERNGPNHQVILPEIPLPTSNGQLVEPPEGYNIEFEEEETGEDAAEEDDDNTDVDGTPNDADGTASSTHTDELVSVKIPTTKTATTTTALVPTQGRKIVVKRRLQQVSSATVGNNTSENLNTTTSVVAGVAGQNIRSGNQAKYRKFE